MYIILVVIEMEVQTPRWMRFRNLKHAHYLHT